MTDLSGKIALVTGANVGIGKVTALELAKKNAHVIMACRNLDTAEAAKQEIIEKCGNENVEVKSLDLGSLASVRKLAEEINASVSQLDFLINNAGVMAVPFKLTEDGFESHFGINHLGHFLLTNMLLGLLKKAERARIVVVTSTVCKLGSINFGDLHYQNRNYFAYMAYAQSKLANILFASELAQRLAETNISVYGVHPGVVNSELYRHQYSVSKVFMWPFKKLCMKTVEQGAATTLYCALQPELEKESGNYFANSNISQLPARCKNKDVAVKLWEVSEKLVGLSASE